MDLRAQLQEVTIRQAVSRVASKDLQLQGPENLLMGKLKIRKRDDAEIFQIKDQRHVSYWMNQAFPVLLVVRNSAGEVRWMEVRDWLREATNHGKKKVSQIVFEGERFDVMSIRRWRERVLADNAESVGQSNS